MMKYEGQPMDTRSEISESGTTNTSGNGSVSNSRNEELMILAYSLGFSSREELYEDHFRIDRKKLEDILLGRSDEVQDSAEDFFNKIKRQTHTSIFWPIRLKVGAKAKKDPHVRIFGRKEDVKYAKEKIMAVLDSRSSRITMKLDVSYTDHSHIIGRGGLTIKKVMEETGCHVHFPDSNRSVNAEKSNQVSIAGSLLGLERARYRIRQLTPLIFCFEYPLMGAIPNANSPFVQIIQDTYNVQVMFRNRPKLHPTLVMIKGSEKELDKTKEATMKLIEHMCGSLANQTPVVMMIEISTQHHHVIEGINSINLKTIMGNTGAQIMFPDASDPIIPVMKKGSVTISGNIDSVYKAREMLIGSLPISIIFEMDQDSRRLAPNFLANLMMSLDVHIGVKKKTNQNVSSIVIRGYERNGTNIYKAQRAIFGSTESPVIATIPQNYQISGEIPSFISNFNIGNNNNNNNNNSNNNNNNYNKNHNNYASAIQSQMSPQNHNNNNMSPQNHNNMSPQNQYNTSPQNHHNNMSPQNHHNNMSPQNHHNNMSPQNHHNNNMSPQNHHNMSPQNHVTQSVPNINMLYNTEVNNTNNNVMSSPTWNHLLEAAQSHQYSPLSVQQMLQQIPFIQNDNQYLQIPQTNLVSSLNNDVKDSLYSSVNSINSTSLLSPTQTSRNSSPVFHGSDSALDNIDASRQFYQYDYNLMRMQAVNAKQTSPSSSQMRVPNNTWAGYGFSESSPSSALKDFKAREGLSSLYDSSYWGSSGIVNSSSCGGSTEELGAVGGGGGGASSDSGLDLYSSTSATSTSNNFSTSNYLESISTSTLDTLSKQQYTDLSNLLTSLSLEKYDRDFKSHEIDIHSFKTLTDEDLKEIGVTPLGARRKLLLAISDLNKSSNLLKWDAAPGAERKRFNRTHF